MRFLSFLILFFCINVAVAQEKSITIKGEIFDIQRTGVINCNIKIADVKTGQIFKYFNTRGNNFFNEKIDLEIGDTLSISISHTSYKSYEKKVAVNGNAINLEVTLEVKTNELTEVNVKAPSKWVRGDTTFYSVDSYKEGDEKKLKDILVKMPDFRVDEKGKLLYKDKPLDKVTVDNEELFADKVELLLNNFPVHVLNTVQAIENQSNQKLLKGLDGANKIFLNLELKKDAKVRTAFGDTELGLDNLGRYNFSPVIFSMYGKVKAGFIGNWNKIGIGISHDLENEIKNKYENEAFGFLMNSNSLSLINNFENRWYIRNNQWDNRVQLNTKINKTLKSQFQFSYIKDKQLQDTYNNSLLYTNNVYKQRIDSNINLYRPKIFSIKENLIINVDSVSELNVSASAYFDQSMGVKTSSYNGFGISSPLSLNTRNNWDSYSLNSDYTVRTSKDKAFSLILNVNREKLKQNGLASSNDIGTVFNVDPIYNSMNNKINSGYSTINLGWLNKLRNARGNILNYGITASYQSLELNNFQSLENKVNNDLALGSFPDNHGDYSIYTLKGNFSKSFKFLLEKPLFLNSSLGVSRFSIREHSGVENLNTLIIDALASQKHNFTKYIKGEFKLGYKRGTVDFANLYQFFYPASLTNFRKNVGSSTKQEALNLIYAANVSLPNDLTSLSMVVSYYNNFRSQVHINTYDSFFQYDNVYLSSLSTRNFTFNVNLSYPALWIYSMLDLNVIHSIGNRLVLFHDEFIKSNFSYSIVGLSFKKNWNKKIFLKVKPSIYSQSSKLPANAIPTKVSTLRTEIYQRYVINEQLSLNSTTRFYIQNVNRPNQVSFAMADLELNYKIKNKPLFFSIKGDNLTNQKNYYYYYNSEQLLNFGSIPLVSRNFYLSAKYNF